MQQKYLVKHYTISKFIKLNLLKNLLIKDIGNKKSKFLLYQSISLK